MDTYVLIAYQEGGCLAPRVVKTITTNMSIERVLASLNRPDASVLPDNCWLINSNAGDLEVLCWSATNEIL